MRKHPSLNIALKLVVRRQAFPFGMARAISQRAGTPVESGLFDWK